MDTDRSAKPGANPGSGTPPDAALDPRRGVRLRLRGNDLIIQPDAGQAPGQLLADLRSALPSTPQEGALLYDQRLGAYRALAGSYRSIHERLDARQYQVGVDFDPAPQLPFDVQVSLQPRSYQAEAIAAWQRAGCRGIVVLPTGAGKTLVAMLAIAHLRVCTLVVVPTLDLLTQWRRALIDVLGAPASEVASYGGGKQDLAPLTVITYDSAAIHTRSLNQFGLIVFDEVHHLPALSYRLAAQGTVAPYRLGLSATPERTDGLERDLATLVGPQIYRRSPQALRRHLASFKEQRIELALSGQERTAYDAAMATYRSYLRAKRIRITSPEDFQRLVIWPSASDPRARVAMLAHREARRLALNAGAKLNTLVELLERHRDDRVIIFSEFNALVNQVSRYLLIPSITHKTPAAEREALLDGFRSGRFSKLVTGRVLNEGVDVPDANVAIVLSGTGTRREHIQRLGRILRPKTGPAVLYELLSGETSEMHLTVRRHRDLAQRPGGASVEDAPNADRAREIEDVFIDSDELDGDALDSGELDGGELGGGTGPE